MAEPLTTSEAKTHLRVSHSSEDAYLDALVKAARMDIEAMLWRAIVQATRTLSFDGFPEGDLPICLPFPPLISVTSVAYLDESAVSRTLSSCIVDATRHPARVFPPSGQDWPWTAEHPAAVTVTFVAGYADGAVPEPYRQLVRLRLGELYEHRNGDAPSEKRTALDRLVDLHKFRDQRILPFLLGTTE